MKYNVQMFQINFKHYKILGQTDTVFFVTSITKTVLAYEFGICSSYVDIFP